MKLKIFLSLFVISMMLLVSSCGDDNKQTELEKVDSIDELIEDVQTTDDSVEEFTITAEPEQAEAGPADSETKTEDAKTTTSTEKATNPSDFSSKPLQGTVVSLDGLVTGSGKVTKAQAQDLVAKGKLLVFQSADGKVYFVYNEDGSFAGKRLAGFASSANVGLLGKTKVVNGVNVFIMTMIDAM